MNEQEISITIDGLPVDGSTEPGVLANLGEEMGIAANGADHPGHPSRRAWIRAGIAASGILRHVTEDGRISVHLLVALIAGNTDPRFDDQTPERSRLIAGHRGVRP